MSNQLDYFKLMRSFWDWAFENPEIIKPNHCALYAFSVEHCNRLGWKPKFGLPTTMAMEALGIKSYNTYIKTLNDLVDNGFIKMIQKSKNQYSANIIALSNIDKALDKALDKAFIKHTTKQSESTQQSIDTIDKQPTSKPIKQSTIKQEIEFPFDSDFFLEQWDIWKDYKKKEHKFQYKSPESEQAALTKLNNLANGIEEIAIKIIHESLANGWSGLFELKNNNTNGKAKSFTQQANEFLRANDPDYKNY